MRSYQRLIKLGIKKYTSEKILGSNRKTKIGHYSETNHENSNIKTDNATDAIFTGKFIILNAFINKPERTKTMNYSLSSRRYKREQRNQPRRAGEESRNDSFRKSGTDKHMQEITGKSDFKNKEQTHTQNDTKEDTTTKKREIFK